jgi:prephenate dehydrogenase
MKKRLADCRIAVVGLGLMGASLCMDLIQRRLCREVVGVARRTSTVLDAFFAGAVDQATNDLHTGVMGADIVVLATPVRTIVEMLRDIGPYIWPGALVMDMGSTKTEICAAMAELPTGVQPIGGHPMTGKETAGFEAAEPNLYVNATWVLSPLERTSPQALSLALELVEAVGARAVVLDGLRHDRLVASISHLPFMLASALVHTVNEIGATDPAVWDLAAGGFRDTSRVAASDTRMFIDILATNQSAVLEQLDCFMANLLDLRRALANADEQQLAETLTISQNVRSQWRPRRS